jgi:hypothetical protein
VTAIPCVASQPVTVNPGAKPGVHTAPAGTIPGTFSVTSSGEASYVLPLMTVPGRAGVEPHLAVAYSGGGAGVLGAGFSLSGLSAITRCPMNLAQDGEIRGVSYDADDPVCLDGKRLVVVSQGSGTIELRTFPDTNVRILAHVPSSTSQPAEATFFEAINPTGIDQPWCAPSGVVDVPPLPSPVVRIRDLPAATAAPYPPDSMMARSS